MRIKINQVNKIVRFEDLQVGEIFCVITLSDVLIKIEDVCSDETGLVNAVSLNDGSLYLFSDRDTVKILKATLTVSEVFEE